MKKINKTACMISTSIVAGFGSTAAIALDNPFEPTELTAGYMNMAEADAEQGAEMKAKDGSCGEGKCGNAAKKVEDKAKEGACGDKKMKGGKAMEGACGDKKADKSKTTEGKCGEGKCGGKK